MWNLPPPPGFQGLHPDKPVSVYQRHLPHWRQDGATYFVTFRLADALPQDKLKELADLKANWEQGHPGCGTPLSRGATKDCGTALQSRLLDETAQESRPTNLSRPTHLSHSKDLSLPTNFGRPGIDAAREKRARLLQERVDHWLDQGMGGCVLADASLASILVSAMHHFDGDRYELGCYVVMPNHAHVIVRPLLPEAHPLETIVGSWKKYSSRRIQHALQREGELWQDESYDSILRDAGHLWRAIQYVGVNPENARLTRESCPLWIRPGWVELGWIFGA
jgi:REP element-mobilizing transposase RayT